MRKLSLRILGVSLLALLLLAVFSQVVAPPASARADSACDDCYAACDAELDTGYRACEADRRACQNDCYAIDDSLGSTDFGNCWIACGQDHFDCEQRVSKEAGKCSQNCRGTNGPCP